ncbi:hypothetical protein PAPYR_4258 [Paratrimastix pyriformis]|uniref:Uncharacterized protein n=1 Tax=Paratrimastix pyriformis TaxID=342808 RepID=A0ABQ8UMM5_9EUKA|nr:hypothetical protein PAPYR_4258 [Paratrimastix pyriformis]
MRSASTTNSTLRFAPAELIEIQEEITRMEHERKRLEDERRYDEALDLRNKIDQLKRSQQERREKDELERQAKEAEAMEEAFRLRQKSLREQQDTEKQTLLANIERKRRELQEKFASEQAAIPPVGSKPEDRFLTKFSRTVFEMRALEQRLAKQQRYRESKEVAVQADYLEREERAALQAQYEQRIERQRETLTARQKVEMDSFEQRAASAISILAQKQEQQAETLSKTRFAYSIDMSHAHALEWSSPRPTTRERISPIRPHCTGSKRGTDFLTVQMQTPRSVSPDRLFDFPRAPSFSPRTAPPPLRCSTSTPGSRSPSPRTTVATPRVPSPSHRLAPMPSPSSPRAPFSARRGPPTASATCTPAAHGS